MKNLENAITERIVRIRKELGLTQAKFGKFMGVSDVTISKIESEQIKINEKHIKLICGTFGVNEMWLKADVGTMFTEDIPGQKQLLEAFRSLSPDSRKMAIKLVGTLLESDIEKGWNEGIKAGNRDEATKSPKQPLEEA